MWLFNVTACFRKCYDEVQNEVYKKENFPPLSLPIHTLINSTNITSLITPSINQLNISSTMKNLIFLAIASLISFSAAEVTLSAGTACGTADTLAVTTSVGTCFDVESTTFHSAKGCAAGNTLRIHSTTGCTGPFIAAASGGCASIGAHTPILSFKCVAG